MGQAGRQGGRNGDTCPLRGGERRDSPTHETGPEIVAKAILGNHSSVIVPLLVDEPSLHEGRGEARTAHAQIALDLLLGTGDLDGDVLPGEAAVVSDGAQRLREDNLGFARQTRANSATSSVPSFSRQPLVGDPRLEGFGR